MRPSDRIVLVLTIAEAKQAAWHVPSLREPVASVLREAEALQDVPRTVLYRDMGDGLTQAAVCFYDGEAADRAAEALWREQVRRAQPVADEQGSFWRKR